MDSQLPTEIEQLLAEFAQRVEEAWVAKLRQTLEEFVRQQAAAREAECAELLKMITRLANRVDGMESQVAEHEAQLEGVDHGKH